MSRADTALDVIARVTGEPRERLRPEMDLVADLRLDSARALELLVALEDALAVELDPEAVAGLNTVGDVVRHLESL